MRETLVLLALGVVGAAGTHLLHPRAPAWREVEEPIRDDEVTMEIVSRQWPGGVLWIDARPRERFAKGHIPGAINLSERELDAQLADAILVLQDNRKPIVIYCDPGACPASRRVRDYLAERLPAIAGFYVLRGGWDAWLRAQAAR